MGILHDCFSSSTSFGSSSLNIHISSASFIVCTASGTEEDAVSTTPCIWTSSPSSWGPITFSSFAALDIFAEIGVKGTCSEDTSRFAGSLFDENKSKGAKVGGGDDESTMGVTQFTTPEAVTRDSARALGLFNSAHPVSVRGWARVGVDIRLSASSPRRLCVLDPVVVAAEKHKYPGVQVHQRKRLSRNGDNNVKLSNPTRGAC
ncbi:hypothetical protein CPC08DRAFT_768216 [Agrocybe pediades]|nr:hypothetical protein CPC08DRAFT_768216 [Agrocybe pediades]